MKTNRKKCNLNELAGIMPVIEKGELEDSVGGDYYYSSSGAYLGQRGAGQDMRICSEDVWLRNQYNGEMSLNSNGAALFNNSNTAWQNAVMTSITGVNSEMYYNYDYYESGHYNGATNILGLNAYGEVSRSSNYFMIMSVLEHEKAHAMDKKGIPTDQREYNAYRAQVFGDYFNNCPNEYKLRVLDMYFEYYSKLYGG